VDCFAGHKVELGQFPARRLSSGKEQEECQCVRERVWYYDFMIKGTRYISRIPGARSKAEALLAEGKARHEVYQGTYGRPKGEDVFIEYAEKVYLPWARENKRSWRSDVYHVATFRAYFGEKRFNNLTPMLIERFKRDRRGSSTVHGNRNGQRKERKAASVNREIACLSKIFSLAVRDGLAGSNPCLQVGKLREANKRYRYLTAEEERGLLEALSGPRAHLRPLVILALESGGRRGELLGLTWDRVDLPQDVVVFADTKSGKDRTVPLSDEARKALLELRASSTSEFVFPSPKTGRRITDVKHSFNAACRQAKIEDFRFHDLRHTFATRLAANGVEAFTIAALLGHADLRMTSRYAHATNPNLRRAIKGLRRTNVVSIEERRAGAF